MEKRKFDMELAEVLLAISDVALRIASKLHGVPNVKGEKCNGENEASASNYHGLRTAD